MVFLVILFIMAVVTSGSIGYFFAYIKNEKENKKPNNKIRNPKAGWYAYC